MLTACVAEPVLGSLGGGPVVYDFFVQTPKERPNPGGAVWSGWYELADQ